MIGIWIALSIAAAPNLQGKAAKPINIEGLWKSEADSMSTEGIQITKSSHGGYKLRYVHRGCLTSADCTVDGKYANGAFTSKESLPNQSKPCHMVAVRIRDGEFLVPADRIQEFKSAAIDDEMRHHLNIYDIGYSRSEKYKSSVERIFLTTQQELAPQKLKDLYGKWLMGGAEDPAGHALTIEMTFRSNDLSGVTATWGDDGYWAGSCQINDGTLSLVPDPGFANFGSLSSSTLESKYRAINVEGKIFLVPISRFVTFMNDRDQKNQSEHRERMFLNSLTRGDTFHKFVSTSRSLPLDTSLISDEPPIGKWKTLSENSLTVSPNNDGSYGVVVTTRDSQLISQRTARARYSHGELICDAPLQTASNKSIKRFYCAKDEHGNWLVPDTSMFQFQQAHLDQSYVVDKPLGFQRANMVDAKLDALGKPGSPLRQQASEMLPTDSVLFAPDIDLTGDWVSGFDMKSYMTISQPSKSGSYALKTDSYGCLGSVQSGATATKAGAVINLSNDVNEYAPTPYNKLYAMRLPQGEFLVRAPQVRRFLHASHSNDHAMWVLMLMSAYVRKSDYERFSKLMMEPNSAERPGP